MREFNRGHVEYIIATDEALKAAAAADGLPAAADAADDENGDAEEGSSGKKQKGKKAVAKDKEYGVARGVDFQGADTVINFELPCDAMMWVTLQPYCYVLISFMQCFFVTFCAGTCTVSAARLVEVPARFPTPFFRTGFHFKMCR